MFQAEVLKQVTRGFETNSKVYRVVSSFSETMLEPLIQRYSLYPAKGTTIAHFAHNSDQMMSTHILNGLFPVLTLVYEAQKRKLYRLSRLSEEELKVYVLSYAMHDLDKILGDTKKFHTRTRTAVEDAYRKIADELAMLQARAFLPTVDNWIPQILWLAVNTQRSRDINLSHTAFVDFVPLSFTEEIVETFRPQQEQFRTGIEPLLRDLCTLSDLLAFLIKTPEDAVLSQTATRSGNGIGELITQLSDRRFSLVYHKLAEVRGFLSNQINNATMSYLSTLYPKEQEPLIPYLFFPNGVVYLNPVSRPSPVIDREAVNTFVQTELQNACQDFLSEGTGLGFDPKGRLAYPGYFHDFLDLASFLRLFAKITISQSRSNIAESTQQAMRALQDKEALPTDISLDYAPDKRISQLGRFLLNYVDLVQKNLNKQSVHLKEKIEQRLMARFGEKLWNEAKRIPSSGGVDYRYYWLAAQYFATHPLEETELEAMLLQCIDDLLEIAGTALATAPELQGTYLQDLSDYLEKNLSFGFDTTAHIESLPNFAGELTVYSAAKKQRGSQLSCTICNSAYTTKKQEDASVLFQPWVYKNRLPLYKGENAGGICSICSLELMLRQLLLKDKAGKEGRINLTGRKYEDMELKYFFLYPGFFFTNQTYHLASYIIDKMSNLKLYDLYKAMRDQEHLDAATLMNLSFFNLTNPERGSIERGADEAKEQQEANGGMYLSERYEEHQYPGFLFFAKKTFRKKNKSGESVRMTTASWVEAAWLALTLPLITGSRVVVTEEYLPLYNSAADFKETVVLDAPHQSLRHLLPQTSARLRLDELYGNREGDKQQDGVHVRGAVAALSRAIELHIDTEQVGGDLKLERFSRIARNLEEDQLFIFAFLKEQMRRDKHEQMSGKKAEHYNDIYRQFVAYYHTSTTKGGIMPESATRHEKVTDLYLQFYLPFKSSKNASDGKPNWPKSHAIVRPIDIAAKCILKDTLNMTEAEIKIEMVQALESWLDIVEKKEATGRIRVKKGARRSQLVQQFVNVFYDEVFVGYAEGKRSVLNSRLNRFKGGCEVAFALWVGKRHQDNQDIEELLDEELS